MVNCNGSIFVVCVLMVFTTARGLNVSIYYEALCPDSVNFIGRQLYPNYQEISNYVNLEFVPYGKAVHQLKNGKWEFLCQHGPNECKANKYQSCVLSLKNGQQKDVDFVYCIMKHRQPSQLSSVEECARRLNLDVSKIRACATSDEGDRLLAEYGDQTGLVALSFVPTIVYDDILDSVAQEQSLKDFVAVVCSKITNGTKPAICDNRSLPKVYNFWGY